MSGSIITSPNIKGYLKPKGMLKDRWCCC